MTRGWFKVPGIRPDGDRTVREQLIGIEDALVECIGKTVLDLGCAEAAISLEFAKSGAKSVLGIELLESHLEIARKLCKDYTQITFHCAHLRDYILDHPDPEQFEIVLALGIIHKLHDPAVPLRWAAQSTKDLLLFRGPGREELKTWDGTIKSKHTKVSCNVPQIMKEEGFVLEQQVSGVRGEGVHYYRRKA